MDATTTHQIGPHTLRYEPDTGFFVLKQVGVLDEAHALRILELFDELNPRVEAPFVIADNSESTSITPAARRAFDRARGLTGPSAYVVTFGGSPTFRAAAVLLFTALKLVGLGVDGTSTADEASARAWLARKREQVLKR
ncbi:MAG TPA: hypothetical protein VK013_13370 [Myxococcaceae bacterium]|nr:hypothetical protein [Myxococcaceae bacterium]